ncbi:WAP four-disulfide core domain protein 2-like [Bufo bufo]|uniref:WAP four-disulfide core domain protein 2-like n=1 Tax=Bufo bufo TaxID=8384 RepID=UPI001ABDA038|nr:WAP four-disulfide core domain protein 2-like [Bufo bufo]
MKLYLLMAFLVELTCVHGADVTESPPDAGKPGVCPVLDPFALEVCFPKCKSDLDCEGVRKCCKTSCNGYQCQIPDEKAGSCPPPEDTNGTTCNPSGLCSSDNKCDGEQKCCPNACNSKSCQNPV